MKICICVAVPCWGWQSVHQPVTTSNYNLNHIEGDGVRHSNKNSTLLQCFVFCFVFTVTFYMHESCVVWRCWCSSSELFHSSRVQILTHFTLIGKKLIICTAHSFHPSIRLNPSMYRKCCRQQTCTGAVISSSPVKCAGLEHWEVSAASIQTYSKLQGEIMCQSVSTCTA